MQFFWISRTYPREPCMHGSLTSGLWRGTNQCYFKKCKRGEENEKGGRTQSKMNGWWTNARLVYAVSSVSHSVFSPLLYCNKSACMCAHTQVKLVVSEPNLCVCVYGVYYVVMCTMAFSQCAKWLRPTECSRGIYTLNHTVQHCNTKGNREWGRERSRKSAADRKCCLKISSLADSGGYSSQLAKCSGGKRTWF